MRDSKKEGFEGGRVVLGLRMIHKKMQACDPTIPPAPNNWLQMFQESETDVVKVALNGLKYPWKVRVEDDVKSCCEQGIEASRMEFKGAGEDWVYRSRKWQSGATHRLLYLSRRLVM